MVVGLRTTGLCNRTMTSPSSFCTCLWSTPWAGGLISMRDRQNKIRKRGRVRVTGEGGWQNKMLPTLFQSFHSVPHDKACFITIRSEIGKERLNRPIGFNKGAYTWLSQLHLKRSNFICIKMTSFYFVSRQLSGLEKRKETWTGQVCQMCDLSALTGAWLNNHIDEWSMNTIPRSIGWEINGHCGTIFQLISHFAHACVSSYKQYKNTPVYEILSAVKVSHILSYLQKWSKRRRKKTHKNDIKKKKSSKESWITDHTNRAKRAKHS